MPRKNKYGEIVFKDYPAFKPNLTPREIFELGSFGGTYWRKIYSSITKKTYENEHKKFPNKWWTGIPQNHLILPFNKYDKTINKYGVKVGSTLRTWEENKWITEWDPYGYIQWYCNFYNGRRCPDDERQIQRFLNLAGPKGRFRRRLINECRKKKKIYDNYKVSPRIRQTLQHWGYVLTERDFNLNI